MLDPDPQADPGRTANPGFDAIVGNPPFAGKNTLINGNRAGYLDWLQTLHKGAHGNADLVAHFVRRAFELLRHGGCFGLIATNTAGQGDTRESGLRAVIEAGGSVLRATRRLPWPGEAAVVVSVVHVLKGADPARSPVLDGRQVRRISAYLVEGDLDATPARLAANAGKAFIGCFLLGMGFTFDDAAAAKGKPASTEAEMRRLIEKDPRNAERIFPYLGGEEVNTDPRHAHRRWCIDFNDFPLRRVKMSKRWVAMDGRERAECRRTGIVPEDYPEPVAADWPDLLKIVERLVKPERAPSKDRSRREVWWRHTRRVPALREAIFGLKHVQVLSRVSAQFGVATVPTGTICAETIVVFADQIPAFSAVLQSRVHELWAAFFASSLEDRLRYGPSDCFENFPFPPAYAYDLALDATGAAYHDHRAEVMQAHGEGLTKLYNRFHDPAQRSPGISRLRELHHAMDQAVLRAYSWADLADQAAPEFVTEDTEPDHRYQGRLFWPAPFRDEVLARLLALNAERAADERRRGLAPAAAPDDSDIETELEDA